MNYFLKRSVSLAVLAQAQTQAHRHEDLGCSILGPASRLIREALEPLKKKVQTLGPLALLSAEKLIKESDASANFQALSTGQKHLGRNVIRDEILYPNVGKTPAQFLHIRNENLGFDAPIKKDQWPDINSLFAGLSRGLSKAELNTFLKLKSTSEIAQALKSAKLFDVDDGVSSSETFSFVGHNTTVIRSKKASVVVDPYFRPSHAFDLPTFQPFQARDIGPIDAVVITHSHGDHFHLGSLIHFPKETKFFVPYVERESIFSTDCVARLKSIGFHNVESMPWNSSRYVKDIQITALPFFGEQPTFGEGVHVGLYNIGNTWLIETPQTNALFVADAGDDSRGSMKQVFEKLKKEKRVDVLFSGVRGFKLKPIYLCSTTLESFLVNVPIGELQTPQQLMADVDTALDWSKQLGVSFLVPCADGGAPWYWREGMGPKYSGFPGWPVDGASELHENPDADPFIESVETRAHELKSLVHVQLLRPGQHWTPNQKPVDTPISQWPADWN